MVQPAASMTPQQFMLKWGEVSLSERSAAQQHFVDLCHLLGQPTPAEADSHGTWFTFEKGTSKTGGGEGFADVWMRDHFAWEYKRPGADLTAAYKQLLLYSENLENPPLLVVCDIGLRVAMEQETGIRVAAMPRRPRRPGRVAGGAPRAPAARPGRRCSARAG